MGAFRDKAIAFGVGIRREERGGKGGGRGLIGEEREGMGTVVEDMP